MKGNADLLRAIQVGRATLGRLHAINARKKAKSHMLRQAIRRCAEAQGLDRATAESVHAELANPPAVRTIRWHLAAIRKEVAATR